MTSAGRVMVDDNARAFFETTPNPRIEKPFDLKTLLDFVNQLIR